MKSLRDIHSHSEKGTSEYEIKSNTISKKPPKSVFLVLFARFPSTPSIILPNKKNNKADIKFKFKIKKNDTKEKKSPNKETMFALILNFKNTEPKI